MIDCVGLVNAKTKTKLLGPILLGVVYDETIQDNDVINRTGTVYAKNETKLLWLIGLSAVCDETR